MTDADNDEVRCRWAKGYECGGICGGMPHAWMEYVSTLCPHAGRAGWREVAVWTDDEFSVGCLIPTYVPNQQSLYHD